MPLDDARDRVTGKSAQGLAVEHAMNAPRASSLTDPLR
jgi:hypothetical protein